MSVCLEAIRGIAADLVERDDVEHSRRERPHVATLGALEELGWRVTELRPSIDAPVQWRVTIERYDGAVSIVVLDAADPDAALEELARYATADAEDPR